MVRLVRQGAKEPRKTGKPRDSMSMDIWVDPGAELPFSGRVRAIASRNPDPRFRPSNRWMSLKDYLQNPSYHYLNNAPQLRIRVTRRSLRSLGTCAKLARTRFPND